MFKFLLPIYMLQIWYTDGGKGTPFSFCLDLSILNVTSLVLIRSFAIYFLTNFGELPMISVFWGQIIINKLSFQEICRQKVLVWGNHAEY